MATSTHNLKIKAVLDTSEIRSQLNGIRESNPVGGGLNSSLDLNNAITRLIQALDKLPSNIAKEQKNSSGQDFNARAFGRFAMGYGVSRVGNSFADLLEAKGYSQAKNVQSALTNIGSGALAGSAFGPAGAALGAAFGVATTAIDYWTDSVKKSQEELQKWNGIIKAARDIENKESKYLSQRNTTDFLKQAIERGDIESLNQVRAKAYEKNLSARELMGKDLPGLLEQRKSIEDQIKELEPKQTRTVYSQSPSTPGGVVMEKVQDQEVIQKVLDLKKKLEDLNSSIENRQSALEDAQSTDQEIAQIDNAIAEIERRQLESKKEANRLEEEQIKAIQKAQEEAKKRVEYETQLNQSINDQIEAYARGEETEMTKKLIESNDFASITKRKSTQDEIASKEKQSYSEFLQSASTATTAEGKEFFLGQAEDAKARWQQAQKQSDALENAQKSFRDIVANELKSREDDLKGSLDTSINDFSSDYKAGLGIGEVGYDVSQEKTDRIIDIASVIKDVLEDMRNEQKTQTEVTRALKGQGLL